MSFFDTSENNLKASIGDFNKLVGIYKEKKGNPPYGPLACMRRDVNQGPTTLNIYFIDVFFPYLNLFWSVGFRQIGIPSGN